LYILITHGICGMIIGLICISLITPGDLTIVKVSGNPELRVNVKYEPIVLSQEMCCSVNVVEFLLAFLKAVSVIRS
jgi:hypothetical protein